MLIGPTLLSSTHTFASPPLIFQAGTHKWEIREVSSGNLLSSSDVIVSGAYESEPDPEEKKPIRRVDCVRRQRL